MMIDSALLPDAPRVDAPAPTESALTGALVSPAGDASVHADDGGASSIAVDLRIAISRVGRRLRAQRGKADLTEGQLGVLTTLKRDGATSPGTLAEREGVRPPSMTRTINALAELGFVTKVEHPTDGRQVVVDITEAGRAEVLETRRRRDLWLAQQIQGLTDAERRALATASELLIRISNR